MAIKINWKDLQKRIINWIEVEKVMCNWVQIRPESLPDDYLCFELANSSSGTATLTKYGTPTEVSLEYSYDKSTWTDYTMWNSLSLTIWQKIYMRNKSTTPTWFSIDYMDGYRFSFSGDISASWDITYLLCKHGTTTLTSNNCFVSLFSNCSSLITPPSLQATTLTYGCYESMFNRCTSLTTAPSLPATSLADRCYKDMFVRCSSLTSTPSLPATTLANYCYEQMFLRCTGLTSAPSLPATTLADYCYGNMFADCTGLTTAPSLPATTLAKWCYFEMFEGCSSLITLPSLPVTTLTDNCYRVMFWWCSKIKLSSTQTWEYQTPYRIPTSWSWTDATNSMTDMFYNTGWTFTGTPSINTTYYTSNTVI